MRRFITRTLSCLLCAALLFAVLPTASLADSAYLIPDSNVRYLTEGELWGWTLESLGYILNEIFARHGYNFEPGGKYDNYFRSKSWYWPNANSNNQQACYPKLNAVEWANESLVKQVMNDMRAAGTTNPNGRSVWTSGGGIGGSVLSGFTQLYNLRRNQTLHVYSAPSASSWRGANGRASVSTNGPVYAAGWENGWLLVMYETNNGAVRVGYVSGSAISGSISNNASLYFDYRTMTCTSYVALTDDPVTYSTSITTLTPGTPVLYLSSYFNNGSWDYIQTTINGQTVRGFIPAGCLQ